MNFSVDQFAKRKTKESSFFPKLGAKQVTGRRKKKKEKGTRMDCRRKIMIKRENVNETIKFAI
jgi:hypothetical protein